MNRPIIYSCIALLAIIGLSIQFLAPKVTNSNNSSVQDTAFEKYVQLGPLAYKLTYEPLELKKKLVSANAKSGVATDRFNDHHYFTLQITNNGLNENQNPVQNWEDLSGYLKDEFKNQFALQINGERKPCVLHHAFTMPQKKDVVVLQLVFKDEGFTGQKRYFQSPTILKFYDHKSELTLEWSFAANELNSTPILNIKHNG